MVILCKSTIFSVRILSPEFSGRYKFFEIDRRLGMYCISFDRFITSADTLREKFFVQPCLTHDNVDRYYGNLHFEFLVSKFINVDFIPAVEYFE